MLTYQQVINNLKIEVDIILLIMFITTFLLVNKRNKLFTICEKVVNICVNKIFLLTLKKDTL